MRNPIRTLQTWAVLLPMILVLLNAGTARGTTVETVLSRYISAVGGEQRLDEVVTLGLDIMVEHGSGQSVRGRMYLDAAKGHVQTLVIDSTEITVQGRVGTICWQLTPEGNVLVPMDQCPSIFPATFICPVLDYQNGNLDLRYGGIISSDSLIVHEIFAIDEISRDSTRLWFDTASGLLVGTERGGLEMTYSEYAEVDGLLLYHRYDSRSQGIVVSTEVLQVKVNEATPDSIFIVPDDVQAELDKRESKVPDVVVKTVSRKDMVAIYNHRLNKLNQRLEYFVILGRKAEHQEIDESASRMKELSEHIQQLLNSVTEAPNGEPAKLQDSIVTSLDNLEAGLNEIEESLK